MLPFRSKQSKRSAEIHLLADVERTSNSTAWLSSEDKCGRVVFKLPVHVDFSHSRIKLKGVVTTRTIDGPDSLSKLVRTEKLPFLGVVLNSKANSGYKAKDGVVSVPFRFNLDAIHGQARSSFVTDLPPSLNSRSDKIDWSDLRKGESEAQYDVTYSIAASAYSKKGLEVSTEKTIQVLPVSQDVDPRLQADCPGEYISARSVSRPRTLSSAKPRPFKLEVAGQSPEAVCLPAQDAFCTSSTRIHFVVKAMSDPSAKFDPNSLPTRCQVSARLLAKTLITPDGIEQHWIPILEQGRHTENTALKTQKNKEQEFAVDMSSWRHVVPGTGEQFAISNFSLDFKISTDQAPVPTFFTPLLSRRYAIDISIQFLGTSNSLLKLALPLQVTYDVNESDDEKLASTVVVHAEV